MVDLTGTGNLTLNASETIGSLAGVAGTTVTLRAPLAFDHKGARDANGVLNFVPHVANVTRTLTFRSANPTGALRIAAE